MNAKQDLFAAIKAGNTDEVRNIVLEDKELLSQKQADGLLKFDSEVELDGYKFLGAYIGSVTAVQYALFQGRTDMAKDLIERSSSDELNITFGGGNTALHLATFLGEKDIVSLLLANGANDKISNNKGFTPVDVLDDPGMRDVFSGEYTGTPADEAPAAEEAADDEE